MRLNAFFISILGLVVISLAAGCKSPGEAQGDEQFARGEFFNAAKTYKAVYNKLSPTKQRKQRGVVAFKLGKCYERLSQSARASAAFQNAVRYQNPDTTLMFRLGRALQGEGKYSNAIAAYDSVLALNPNHQLAQEGKRGCKLALAVRNGKKTRYVVKPARFLNSQRSDFAPMYLDKTLNTLYFTSTTEKSTGSSKSEVTGAKRGDIYFVTKNEKGVWQRPEPIAGEFNTEADEGVTSFSPDGQTMYLSIAKRLPNANTSVEIYTSQRSDASWSTPQKFEITADTISAYGDPAVSADGNWLYFASDMPGGYGGKDIWRINLKDKGGSLENLGPQINTAGDERFPYSRNDTTLYFSSDGHPGFGGLDLFVGHLNSTRERWSVENMGMPMNSAGDDFGITFGSGESGFFSSNRNDARGYDNIYSFELPELKIFISGMAMDKDEEPVANAIIRIVGDDGSNQKEISRTDGSFRFKLERGVKYVMKAGAEGYLNVSQQFESSMEEEDAEYGIDFVLMAVTKPQVIENIFYDFDRATLRPESKSALDELVKILNENPHIVVEIGSHTDAQGAEDYNMGLSERRAKSVVDYLIGAGIPAERLTSKGYGESVPKRVTKRINHLYPQFPEDTELNEEYISTLSPEDQEAAHQVNRRTELTVVARLN